MAYLMSINSQKNLACMKWEPDGELSFHDTKLLITRLAGIEKSRRGLLDHHEKRRWQKRMVRENSNDKHLAS